jgi:hypothetical protein
MRFFPALAAAILLVSPAFAVQRHRATLPPRPSPCPNAVIAKSVSVSWFALADDTIYFADSSGGLLKVPKGGGTPMPIASNLGIDIGTIVVDNTSVYFITRDSETTGSIYSVPRSGGTPKLLATNLPAPIDMRLDATSIYWLNLGTVMGQDVAADGSVERMLKDGTGRQKLVGNLSAPGALDVDATDVYFSETGFAIGNTTIGLRRVSKSGGTVTKLVDDSAIFALALSGSDVFFSGADTNGVSIARIAKAGGMPQQVLDGTLAITMVVRDSRIYVVGIDIASQGLAISSVTTSGTEKRVLTTEDLDNGAIAVDDCALYYAANSSLLRTPR